MQSQNTLNKLSRRNWLRDAAIAATGAVVLPSFFTGCTDHVVPEPRLWLGAPADPPITEGELRSAAKNLIKMKDWLVELHISQTDYEIDVLEWLKSGTDRPSSWSDFIINILLDIAVGIITAAADAAGAVTGGAAAIAGLAIASELLKKFAFPENRPHDLDGSFVEFKDGQDQLYMALKNKLRTLAEETDNYKNLREGFKEAIDFNGKKYTLRDLANADFPGDAQGTAYVALQTAAYDQFRRNIWNVMFIKAGSMTYTEYWSIRADISASTYAQNTHYKDHPETYLRGWLQGSGSNFERLYFRHWYFEFDGRQLSSAAAAELFKDDYPEHIINPKGLFLRSYVFKQFHTKKPDFFGYHELRKDIHWGNSPGDCYGFDCPDDYEFTGGNFPQLIKK